MQESKVDRKQLDQLINKAQRLRYEAKQIMFELNRVLTQMEPLIRRKKSKSKSE